MKIKCLDVKGAQEIAKVINDCADDAEASWCGEEVIIVSTKQRNEVEE